MRLRRSRHSISVCPFVLASRQRAHDSAFLTLKANSDAVASSTWIPAIVEYQALSYLALSLYLVKGYKFILLDLSSCVCL